MTELAVISPEQFGLKKDKAAKLTGGLDIVLKEREMLIGEFNNASELEITVENVPTFRDLRLRIAKNRTAGIVKWHKEAKDYFLRGGQFVDAIKRKEVSVNEVMEQKLLDAEKHFERLEAERKAKLHEERAAELAKYEDEPTPLPLGDMMDEVWDAFITTKKRQYEERIAAEEKAAEEKAAAEKKAREEKAAAAKKAAEERRIAEEKARKERERIEAENAKLKAAIERKKKADAAKKKKEEAAKAKAKAERERLQAIIDKKAEDERIAAEKAEAERQAKLNRGDEEKVRAFIEDLTELKSKYTFDSEANKEMYAEAGVLINKIIYHISK